MHYTESKPRNQFKMFWSVPVPHQELKNALTTLLLRLYCFPRLASIDTSNIHLTNDVNMVLVQLNVTNAKTMLLYTVIYKKKKKKCMCSWMQPKFSLEH